MVTPLLIESLWRYPFAVLDLVRRAQGDALAAAGFGPSEFAYRVLATGHHWRLRNYAGPEKSPSLLIVAAPIKRPYIWDLAPTTSAIRYCVDGGLHVYLVEWTAPAQTKGQIGFDECVEAIGECSMRVARQSNGTKPFLMGHSLGGTLAAIFSAYDPQAILGLLLLSAPLCFQSTTNRFRDALVSIMPPDLPINGTLPGSLLSHASALASPGTFIWSRLLDAALSLGDLQAWDINARVERWSLDETALPGKLIQQIVDRLYRENCFCRGTLTVRGRALDPSFLSLPTLAVVNTSDEVAPLASIEPFLEAARDVALIKYAGETGVGLQHLGVLVGREAHTRVWPDILAWLKAHCQVPSRG
jgi:polyhydroxyalkanoate synthase subunit PhaC